MCLREADIPPFVDSASGRITKQLEVRALRYAQTHRRISGFWQISWLKHAADGLETFILNEGDMDLVIGLPCEETYDDLILASRNLGSAEYRRRVRDEFFRQLTIAPSFRHAQSRELLEKLVASGHLRMKILPNAGPNARPEHGKMQVYYDECVPPCWVYAGGSKNDSDHGDRGGVDFMSVTRSWNGDQSQLKAGIERYFAKRWAHPNAVGLGGEATARLLEHLRNPAPLTPRTQPPSSVSRAFELLDQQADCQNLLIVPEDHVETIRGAAHKIGVVSPNLHILGISDPKVLLVFSQYVEEKPVVFVADAPSVLQHCASVWDGPTVSLWADLGQFEFESRLDSLALVTQAMEEFGLAPSTPTRPLYRYNHPSGPQEHQLQAIETWRSNGRRALFEHATGTFKTATGLTVAAELLESSDTPLVVIAAPQISIADNWATQARRDFDHPEQLRIVQCYSGHDDWLDELEHYALSSAPTLAIFVNDSLWKPRWWHILRRFEPGWGLIADEVHNWAIYQSQARVFMSRAPRPSARLALTAQLADPARSSEALPVLEWFATSSSLGVHRFGLTEAMDLGLLREYDYEVRPLRLEAGDTASDVSSFLRQYKMMKQDRAVEAVLELCQGYDRVLLYTGPEIEDASRLAHQIRIRLAAADNFSVETFTSRESAKERARILQDFRHGLTKVLVAVRCLDEGVDLPVADAAVMCLSNEDERQWIQRRGRILRNAADAEQKVAKILDFLPVAPLAAEAAVADQLHRVAEREIRRALSFAKLARISTRSESMRIIQELGHERVERELP